MTPRVSVVTTVYNGEPYVDRAIPGILSQTFTDFEWVLVNDGSQDKTEEILRDLEERDSRVRVFSPGRLGITGAANFGVNQARGEDVARQDFDDRSYPDRLRLQVAVLDANPRVGVVGGHYLVIDQNRNERYVRMPPSEHEDIIPAMAEPFPWPIPSRCSGSGCGPRRAAIPRWPTWKTSSSGSRLPSWAGASTTCPSFWESTTCTPPASSIARSSMWIASGRWQRCRQRSCGSSKLPPWMYLFALGRYGYAYCPTPLKRMLRRTLGGSEERDLA